MAGQGAERGRGAGVPDEGAGEAGAVTDCEYCGGYGEIFGHADDCFSEWCALACGIDDCDGKVEPCPGCKGKAERFEGGREG